MVMRGKQWILAALVAAVGAWSAPMEALAASTALCAASDHGTITQSDPKNKNHHKHKKDDKPPQTLASKEPKKDCKDCKDKKKESSQVA